MAPQEAKLHAAWEEHGGAPGATAAVAAECGLAKAAAGRHLKALGLERGVLTVKQVPFLTVHEKCERQMSSLSCK